jgi:glycosyltransferase involved in cell wall biosynthesis
MSGLPEAIDFIAPSWTLNIDPDPDVEATSWRLSLRACIVKTHVLRELGGPRGDFQTIEGASLEMGHRYISAGVLPRHLPGLLPRPAGAAVLPPEDERRFLRYRYSKFWNGWAAFRAIMTGYTSLGVAGLCCGPTAQGVPKLARAISGKVEPERVSVLIPTLDRYAYLRTVLGQLRQQTVLPAQVIVVDQTPCERKQPELYQEFRDLPMEVIQLTTAGQCTARNAGLRIARADYVLFIDDDDEIPPDLIESHLRTLSACGADVSCGIADEAGAGPMPAHFRIFRASDVFPTNNTMMRRDVLLRSGLFDLAYDRGARADGDLGIRIYRSGALMVLNPAIRVFHHRAPRGGLRQHRARVTTAASSRRSLFRLHLPSVTEAYLLRRHFTRRQLREAMWLRAFASLNVQGGLALKILKALIGAIRIPHTIWRLRRVLRQSREMMRRFPEIPSLEESGMLVSDARCGS